ncbi:MAG TPA: homoserine dehydrogenase [Candidatus Sumerlaeota bacterium]|nr:homoserine dehydrogenase [Candidatus Sumerlaeota bacterium]HRR31934.1 homoserine dehydrogenase [Candidatus Sumerlaeia bacterium]HON49976.1 homoserine dehydrogenase [Candidatus Sumerlaeota bacterium]HOR63776.1 homoserine dehydrogenase [Candidatus Sumerlaeota bacterium]HPL74472.1 homoserine dehydrogenase [Candidatus Sumerlaeota bacterium]
MVKTINVGLIGFGNIGTGVVRALNENSKLIMSRLSCPIKIARIADIDITRQRPVKYDKNILTDDTMSVVKDPSIDIIIELIGGTKIAKTVVETALRYKKHVVTANKALLAHFGADLFALARENEVSLLFESSVGAGIPIIRSLAYSYAADRINTIRGILNGTTNYILTNMEEQGRDFQDVLKEAQEHGYAEPDPTFDVEGFDTAHKLCILASMAFGQDIRSDSVYVNGITQVQKDDLVYARELGYIVKLLGIAKLNESGKAEVRVHPTLIPRTSTLASVRGVYNAIEIEGEPIGAQMLYGRGAGWGSTASGVLGDVIDLANAIVSGANIPYPINIPKGKKNIRPISELSTAYYLRMTLKDEPGMLARVATVFGDQKISIKTVLQKTSDPGKFARVIFITHTALEGNLQKALNAMKEKKLCREKPFVLRVEE